MITLEGIKKVFKKKKYKYFTGKNYDLNVIGFRSRCSESDKFDDFLIITYKDFGGDEHIEIFPATTDSGKHWLLNPMNVRGTAITVPNQYPKSHKLGIHGRSWSSGGYKALEQVNKMFYVRDNNKDSKLDFSLMDNPENIFADNLKTNIHRASKWKTVLDVHRYSAGCTVVQDPNHFDRVIQLVEAQERAGYGDHITFTLITEDEYKNVN